MTETFAEGSGRLKAEVTLEGGGIGVGYGDVARLHGDELLVGVEVVVGREDTGTEEFFLEDGDEIEKVLQLVSTEDVAGIDLGSDIIKEGIVAVSDDGL